jgi:hypothetical protein
VLKGFCLAAIWSTKKLPPVPNACRYASLNTA